MKPSSRLMLLAALISLAVTTLSCKKVLDKLYKDPLATLDACYINQITTADDGRIYDFTYNKKGNPVSVLNNNVGTGYPNYFFRYDKHHRLTDMIGVYTNGNYERWHKYGYDHQNRIVKDTQYVFGVFGPAPDPASVFIIVHTYSYDSYQRLTGDNAIYLQPSDYSGFTNTYNYDGDGNRIGGVYDNKVNLHRTNKIWMFVDKDYSLNNRIGASSYNSNMLPLGFGASTSMNFLGVAIHNSEIDYTCKGDSKK